MNPHNKYPVPPFPKQRQEVPGTEAQMMPKADHGEESYQGSGKLEGKKAVITGGDSGIGRAVALAFAREGADVLISYGYDVEDKDADTTLELIKAAGRKGVAIKGDIQQEEHCIDIIEKAVQELRGLDILVNNAAYQMSHKTLQEITAAEWNRTFATNIHAMFYLSKAAEPHLKPGCSIINTASVVSYNPNIVLLDYAATKGAI